MKNDPFLYFDTLIRSGQIYASRFMFFFFLSFLAHAMVMVNLLIDAYIPVWSSLTWMLMPAQFGMYVLFSLALIKAIGMTSRGEAASLNIVIQDAWLRAGRGMVCVALFIVLLTAGAILLIIPFFYWVTIFYFFMFVLVFEDTKVFESLRRSKELVSGNFTTVLKAHGFTFIVTLALFIPIYIWMRMLWLPLGVRMFVTSLLGMFLLPLFSGFYFQLYTFLRLQKDGRIKIYEKLDSSHSA